MIQGHIYALSLPVVQRLVEKDENQGSTIRLTAMAGLLLDAWHILVPIEAV